MVSAWRLSGHVRAQRVLRAGRCGGAAGEFFGRSCSVGEVVEWRR